MINVPKWEMELYSFLGIKSGIVLEGNIHDDFLCFSYEKNKPHFLGVDDLDQVIFNLIDRNTTSLYFFNPLDGFYTYEDSIEQQKLSLEPLFKGFKSTDSYKNHGCTFCRMPISDGSVLNRSSENDRFIYMSQIIKNAISGQLDLLKDNVTFVINLASRLESCNIRQSDSNKMFMSLLEATTINQLSQLYCNSIIFVVDKYNDIPAWFYLNNPNIHTIPITVPDRNTRRLYLSNLYGELEVFKGLSNPTYQSGKKFISETDGMQLKEIRQILQLAYKQDIKPDDISTAFRLYKYGVIDNPWETLDNDILLQIKSTLEHRVKGQNEALTKVKLVLTRAVKGLSGLQHSSTSSKPKGILFFAGPTGVGKTETAKAIAESLFGDENACIRFDMSEYRQDHSDQKLFGAPPGYIGYEGGGQLTNAVKNRPFSVLLFDEIEKASPTILDKFLQILEDGRMTDNQGNTVYFGETLIIFTSNNII